MSKTNTVQNVLQLIDKNNYILDGTLFVIEQLKGIHQDAKLDEQSVRQTVAEYKHSRVDRGMAFGVLENKIIQDTRDELSEEQMLKLNSEFNPKDNFEIHIDQDFEEKELNEENVAFQILDIMYDQPNRRVVGRIQLLDTSKGMEARSKIEQGLKCYISSSGVEDVVVRDKSVDPRITGGKWAFLHKLQSFKEGWKLSFIGRGDGYGF
jgi:hypothetical protein